MAGRPHNQQQWSNSNSVAGLGSSAKAALQTALPAGAGHHSAISYFPTTPAPAPAPWPAPQRPRQQVVDTERLKSCWPCAPKAGPAGGMGRKAVFAIDAVEGGDEDGAGDDNHYRNILSADASFTSIPKTCYQEILPKSGN